MLLKSGARYAVSEGFNVSVRARLKIKNMVKYILYVNVFFGRISAVVMLGYLFRVKYEMFSLYTVYILFRFCKSKD